TQWCLVDKDGVRRRIDARGVLFGRSPKCDVILRDPKASRSQALAYLEGESPRFLLLGKGRTELNGVRAEREAKLASGDRISLPGIEFEVSSSAEPIERQEGQGWVLDRPGGGLFGVSHGPFVVGGHEE